MLLKSYLLAVHVIQVGSSSVLVMTGTCIVLQLWVVLSLCLDILSLALLNVSKEVETSAAHFVVEINQEEGELACLHRAGCKLKFLGKFFTYSGFDKTLASFSLLLYCVLVFSLLNVSWVRQALGKHLVSMGSSLAKSNVFLLSVLRE